VEELRARSLPPGGAALRAARGRAAAAVLQAALVAAAAPALAESSAECERVRALADSQAALLYAPSLEVHGGKFPESVAVEPSARTGDDYQLRAALSLSLLDVYKGRRVEWAAEHECAQREAARALEEVLLQAADYGRLPALQRTARFLEERRARWRKIEQQAQQGLAARVVSLLEADEVQQRCVELERRAAAVAGEIARLEALGAATAPQEQLTALLHAADDAALEYEREASHLRSLEAWEVRVTGGAAPNGGSTDYFGVAHVRFNLGAFAQRAAEQRAIAAREAELQSSRSELRERLRMFRGVAAGNASHAARAAGVVSERLASLRALRATLEGARASMAVLARSLVELEVIAGEAELVFLETWLAELRRLGDAHAS
jgi:hypothetical protein